MNKYIFCLFAFATIIKFSSCEHSDSRSVKNCGRITAQCTTSDLVTVTRNGTTLITPTSFPRTCIFDLPRQPGVCQLRLDFPKLNLNDPMPNGNCMNDSMSITGSVTVNGLDICGTGASAANHMYLDYGSTNNILIRLKTLGHIGMGNDMYGYEIRVTQIECDSVRRVPQDCLQYYTERTGVVSSYNYPRQQLNNENYRVCIEKQSAGDRIQWTLCNGTDLGLGIPFNPINMCLEGEGCGPQPSVQRSCDLDYIEIPGGIPNNRYCKNPFPASVTSENFWLLVHFDEIERQNIAAPIHDSDLPCSNYDATMFPNYILVSNDMGGCSFSARGVDIMNSGFCLAYTVL